MEQNALHMSSFLSAIMSFAEQTIDSGVQSVIFDERTIIFRKIEKLIKESLLIVIISEKKDSATLLKSGYIISDITSHLMTYYNFQRKNIPQTFYDSPTKHIDEIVYMNPEQLSELAKEEHIVQLEEILKKLSEKLPLKSLLTDSRLYFENKKITVDPSITFEDALVILERLQKKVDTLFGKDSFELLVYGKMKI